MAAKKNKAKNKRFLKEKTSKAKINVNFWKGSAFILAVLLIISIITGGFQLTTNTPTVEKIISDVDKLKSKTSNESLTNALDVIKTSLQEFVAVEDAAKYVEEIGNKIIILEYSEFQCPFSKRAADDAVAKLRKNFGDAVEIEFKHFPLSFHPFAQKASEASECARDQGKFWEYHDILFKNQNKLDVDSLKKYADDIGLNIKTFDSCLDNEEKKSKVQADIVEGQQKGVSGTPAFFIGETMITGAQPYETFLPILCKELKNHDACLNAPKPVEFKMYVIEDKKCVDCDSSRIIEVTKQLFTGVEIVKQDYDTKEGKELYDEIGLVYMPMYVMEKIVEEDINFEKIKGAMILKGDYYAIQPQSTGSTFDPNSEICTNGIDDNDDGVVDCDDNKCKNSLECREEKPNNIDLFIMSDCPYGRKAVEGLKGALDNFGDVMNFDIHYIASENGDAFRSLHGQYEVDEDISQLCAKNLSLETYFDYVYCRSVNGVKNVGWEDCANEASLDIDAMKSCIEGEQGKSLLREDIKIASTLNIGGSPTWIVNNRYKFSGLDAETVRSNFCKYNEDVDGCDTTLSQDTTIPSDANC